MAVARAVLSAISRFVSAMAMLNFGGQQTVSTSVQNFVRMMLMKRGFVCSIPPRLQVSERFPIIRLAGYSNGVLADVVEHRVEIG
jgi:hypothetical protein